jgi:son of sevenless
LLSFSFANHDFSPRQRSQPSSKVKKIFGDDAPSPTLMQKPPTATQTPDTAWFLKHDLENDLAYDVKGQVKGGTLDALIERLTRHDMMDSTFNQTFLLTFKSFTTHEEFFDKLVARYCSQVTHFNVDSIFLLRQDFQTKKSKPGKKKFNVVPN